MSFTLPAYIAPDFTEPRFCAAPEVTVALCEQDGVAPEGYHGTSIFPEYFHIGGVWRLAEESRMDCAVIIGDEGCPEVVELRRLRAGDRVVLGRGENAEEGVFVHTGGFADISAAGDKFAFRGGRSRETAFSRDYDNLYDLLRYERERGNILWVLGPAAAFDFDARRAMQALIGQGFAHGLLAGNALATHDLEAALFGTALGQDIYTQQTRPLGHYNHLDTINAVRRAGSISAFIKERGIAEGIMAALTAADVPYVLTGSIRDDGPLPGVYGDTYAGQDAMRALIRKATTIICVATQLHTIATGNMAPTFRVVDGAVRPLFLYTVDISEFAAGKLSDRGSLSAVSMVTNAQDFMVNVARGVGVL